MNLYPGYIIFSLFICTDISRLSVRFGSQDFCLDNQNMRIGEAPCYTWYQDGPTQNVRIAKISKYQLQHVLDEVPVKQV